MTIRLPALFIGSSVEGLHTAYAIQQALEYEAEPTVWSQGIFQPSNSALSDLVKSLSKFDFAVFVLSPDDAARSDGNLLAALGPACNVIRNAIKLHAQALQASLDTARPTSRLPASSENASDKLQRYLNAWNGEVLTQARELVRKGVPMSVIEVDDSNQPEWDAFNKAFYFFESLSAAIVAGEIDSVAAKKVFGETLPRIWKHACTALTMPNHVEESWNPPPHIASVNALWSKA